MTATAGVRAHGPAELSLGSVPPEEKPYMLGRREKPIGLPRSQGRWRPYSFLGIREGSNLAVLVKSEGVREV